MIRALAALVVIASACGKKDSAPAPGSAAPGSAAVGSAGGSAAGDPWSGSGSAPAKPETPCTDDDIKKHIDDSLSVSMAYLSALEKKSAKWGKDCEAAKRDLLALEPDAQKFMDAMLAFRAWGESLSDTCRARVAEVGDKLPIAAEIEKRTPALEAKVKPILEKCENHPGFKEAAAKGLRVLRKKR